MSVVLLGSTSGSVTLQEPAVAGSTTINLPATSGTMAVLPTATSVLPEASGGTGTTTGYYGFKNRIINGAMVIDQRNAGASVTPSGGADYTLDRWLLRQSIASKFSIQQNAPSLGSVTPPVGYTNYLGATVVSAYSITSNDFYDVRQFIEGYNIADLGWGTANAQAVTISFWVRSSLTGTFGGAVSNNGGTRSYPFTYLINSANTWEQKTITILGDTSGTWLTTNGIGIRLTFGLGAGSSYAGTAGSWAGANYVSATGATSVVGTNGATFYITGVQLEKGSTATSFDYRPYGTELALCQRYYYKWINDSANNKFTLQLQAYSSVAAYGKLLDLPVPMRSRPTANAIGTFQGNNATGTSGATFSATVIDSTMTQTLGTGGWTGASGMVAGNIAIVTVFPSAYIEASAEL